MSNEASPGDQLYLEGLSMYESSLAMGAGDSKYDNLPREDAQRLIEAQISKETELLKQSIKLFEQALSARLDDRSEILCRRALGLALFDLDSARAAIDFVVNSGLSSFTELDKAVAQLEQALALDVQRATRVMFERTLRSAVLQRLDVVWQRQSLYLKNQFGSEKKLSYLQEKLNLLNYLGGVKPPGLCLSFAFHYKDVHNRPLTLEWLKNAAAADDYGDLENKSFFHDVATDNKQRAEKGIREMSSPKKATQSTEKKTVGGCFVATAVYGSSIAPEVIIFRRFRDDVLLGSAPGRIGINLYYRVSPPLASFISKSPFLRVITNFVLLRPILFALKRRGSGEG